MDDVLEEIVELVSAEAARTDDDLGRELTLRKVERYLRFLRITAARIRDASGRAFRAQALLLDRRPKEGTARAMTRDPEIRRLLEESRAALDEVHLDTEAYYLFAKILVDKVAHTFECWMGPARGCSLVSHTKLKRHARTYFQIKNVCPSASFMELLERVDREVTSYRDKAITHEQSFQVTHATRTTRTGEVRIAAWNMEPSAKAPVQESRELDALERLVEGYVHEALALLCPRE